MTKENAPEKLDHGHGCGVLFVDNIPADVRYGIKAEAAKQGIPMKRLIRQVLEDYLRTVKQS